MLVSALLDKVTSANQQTSTETYLLLAQVQLEQEAVQSAQQTLEVALSNSFQVSPNQKLIDAVFLLNQKRLISHNRICRSETNRYST